MISNKHFIEDIKDQIFTYKVESIVGFHDREKHNLKESTVRWLGMRRNQQCIQIIQIDRMIISSNRI